jgi:HSP20 family protein
VAFGSSDFDRMFDSLWNGLAGPPRAATLAPRIDFTETDAEFRIAAELPGLEEKDIEVSLEDGLLTIRGERAAEERTEAAGVRHFETGRGKFARSLRLPAEVDADAVRAMYRNGILTVTLPKAPEAQPRNIPVTAAS